MTVSRGDVVLVDLDGARGSEQGKTRLCVILQNDIGNKYSPTTIVAPMTSQIKHTGQPTHTVIRKTDSNGLVKDSMVLCEQVRTIDKNRVLRNYGNIGTEIQNVFRSYLSNFGAV